MDVRSLKKPEFEISIAELNNSAVTVLDVKVAPFQVLGKTTNNLIVPVFFVLEFEHSFGACLLYRTFYILNVV